MWFNLRPQEKYGLPCVDFHETHKSIVCEDFSVPNFTQIGQEIA
jgi:hypothetical protein